MSLVLWTRQAGQSQPLYTPYSSLSIAVQATTVTGLTDAGLVAAIAFLIWDILITLDDEVKYVWPQPWSYTRFIYFFIRYGSLLVQLPLLLDGTELTPLFHFSTYACFLWGVYQVLALYHQDCTVKLALACGYVAEFVSMSVGLAFALPGVVYDNLCIPVKVPQTFIFYGVAPGVFQFSLFAFTLYKFIQVVRSGWGRVPLLVLLVRDGTWAFFVLAFVYCAQFTSYYLRSETCVAAFYSWQLTSLSVCGYRIMMNVRSFSGQCAMSTKTRRKRTDIEFAQSVSPVVTRSGRDSDDEDEEEYSSFGGTFGGGGGGGNYHPADVPGETEKGW